MPEQDPSSTINQPSMMNELISRIRILERSHQNSREKILLINQNMIEEYKDIIEEMRNIKTEVKETKKDILKIQDTFKKVIDEMNSFARKEDIKVLEKYINMWNPINFVTEEEVLNLIKKKRNNVKKRRTS
jgi:sugar phosphate isomerase/epimerase